MPTPPGSEGFRLASFQTLRSYADISSFLRMCIDKRIEEILGLEWDIIPTLEASKADPSLAEQADWQNRRLEAMKFFSRPDPEYNSYHSWMRAALEDIFVIDALSIYIAPPRVEGKGLFGSNLAALALIAGETIRPMIDVHGERPQAPDVAFQQYLYGVPRVDLVDIINQSDIDEDLGVPDAELRGDQLLYLPYRKRTTSPYGMSHVESCLIPVSIELSKQKYAMSYYTDGNVPPAWVTIGNADTPQQIRQWQDSLDAMIGDLGARHQVVALPHGSTTQETKPNAFEDQYDMANKEEILGVFGLTAAEVGMQAGRSSGSGMSSGQSAGNAQVGQTATLRTATKPLLMWLKRELFDLILQQTMGQNDMQWQWTGLEPAADVEAELATDTQLVGSGIITRDEVRIKRGWKPFGLPLTKEPTVMTKTGVMSLASDAAAASQEAPPDPLELAQAQTQAAQAQNGDDNEDDDDASAGPTAVIPTKHSGQGAGGKPSASDAQHADDNAAEPTKAMIAELVKMSNGLPADLPASVRQTIADLERSMPAIDALSMVGTELALEAANPLREKMAGDVISAVSMARVGRISEDELQGRLKKAIGRRTLALSSKSTRGDCLMVLSKL
jgi:hypothetical protein